MTRSRILFVVGLVAFAASIRLFPHPPNFTPIAAMALFAGCHLADRRLALAIPLAAMLLTDLVLGMHATMPFVYAGIALTVVIGSGLARRRTVARLFGAAMASSVLFFAISNFGVWLAGGLYPLTAAGLTACYVAAIPFFQNSLLGDVLYTGLLFGGMAIAEQHLLAVRERRLTLS